MLVKYTDIDRATQHLRGILMGICIDNKITDEEVYQLGKWLQLYIHLQNKKPFQPVFEKISQVIADHYIDEEEREEILELCWMFDKESHISQSAIVAVKDLHGVLQGIAMDNKIRDNEVIGLKGWLDVYEHVKEYWPFSDLLRIITDILSDGIISDTEKKNLLKYCKSFSEILEKSPRNRKKEDTLSNDAPRKPLSDICNQNVKIDFSDKTFCFAGSPEAYPREFLQDIVLNLGGILKKTVTFDLDYLIIGGQGHTPWAYTLYGRIIDHVLSNQKKGSNTKILHEFDFLEQAGFGHLLSGKGENEGRT